jgi:hypothetical protein
MDKDKKSALIIGAILALIIIWFLLYRKGFTKVLFGDDTPLKVGGLNPLNINLGDLIVPNLGNYIGVSSCGCSGGNLNLPPTPNYDRPARPVESNPVQSIGRTTPAPYRPVSQGRMMTMTVNNSSPANGRADATGRYSDGTLSRFF